MNRKRIATLVVSALLAASIDFVYHQISARLEAPRTPPPSVALTCVTAGLPDLAVVCKFNPWPSEIEGGFVDFGDGRPPLMLGSALTGGGDKLPSEKQVATEQDLPDNDLGSVGPFYWKYRDPGSYRVNLVVTDKDGLRARDHQSVTVALSDELQDEINVQHVDIVAFQESDKSETLEQPLEKQVAYRLSVHNLIFYERRSYSVKVRPDPNWILTRCVPFEKSSSYLESRLRGLTDSMFSEQVAEFTFDLESSPFFSGSEDGYLYGTIKCWQIQEGNIATKLEKELEPELPIDRFGIIERDLGDKGNPMVVSGNGNWQLKIKGRNTGMRPWTEDYVHGQVRIRLVDPTLIPPEIRRDKLYLRIEPK